MREKPIALQEMHGTTTAEASRFLLGQKTYVARKWLRAGVLPCVEAVACHIRIHRRTRIQCTFSQHPAQKDLKSHEKIPKQNLWSIGIIQEQYWLSLSLGGTLTTWVTGPIQPDFFPPWKCDQSNMCSCKKKKDVTDTWSLVVISPSSLDQCMVH